MTEHEKFPLLKISLEAAVPLWISELKQKPWSEVAALTGEAAQIIAKKGDLLLYKSEKPGETAKVFNALARGIAIGAFAPGGITVFGLHFEAEHPGEKR